MNKKIKYILMGLILISSVLIVSARLEVPNEDRDCYSWGTSSNLFMCFIPDTGAYAKWFTGYQEMNSYYTPQLKETAWGVGNMALKQSKVMQVGTLTITGSPSYSYTKR